MAIKKVTKDYGLRQRELESFSPETAEEQERLFAALSRMMGPDDARKHKAKLIRGALAKAGVDGGSDRKIIETCGPESFHVLGAEWLRMYEHLTTCRARVEAGRLEGNDLQTLIFLAEALGKLTERIWWRHGVDPETGEKRETLALKGRKEKKTSRAGHEKAHGTEAEKKAEWQRIVGVFDGARQRGMRVGDAQKHAAKKCKVSVKSVQRACKRLVVS